MKEEGTKHQEASLETDKAVQVVTTTWHKNSLGEGSRHWKQ